jgi:CYTH domain-containing protein
MAIEIERKFLVKDTGFLAGLAGTRIAQGYLADDGRLSVRVRISGEAGQLTVKAGRDLLARTEYEYAIPAEDARAMLDSLCRRPLIDKTRYLVGFDGGQWEVDVFHGDNAGLVVAEIELTSADAPFARPPWLGEEVTADTRYLNVSLVRHPYSRW